MSTAKSMATSYLNGKRNNNNNNSKITLNRFKSSTSNLAANKTTTPRLKSTSMTNLIADQESATSQVNSNPSGSRIQRPVSRNALDSIHNGMNAKYAQVQSKVLLQNIRPQNSPTKIPAASSNATTTANKSSTLQDGRRTGRGTPASSVQSERMALQTKLKALEEELVKGETEREQLKAELERERLDKAEQVNQLKIEIQEKLSEHDKHNEEYHQKLLEAYELADQNRRAADSVLAESRQRDEESRKKVEELEGQLNELKEFVAMKEEMTGKMFELREQIREERQRYEEQLKSLHQVFENEKISETKITSLQNEPNNNNTASGKYFERQKPSLDSCESINKLRSTTTNCQRCLSGASQLHRSEQDIYGSKMSTRMQESARSAWRASKQFASSVITGGVGLSACRQCKKRNSSISDARGANIAPAQRANSQQVDSVSAAVEVNKVLDNEQHTSVIEVGAAVNNRQRASADAASAEHHSATGAQQVVQVQPLAKALPAEAIRAAAAAGAANNTNNGGLIRVDGNNKLTIVTKFNDECQANQEGPSSGSEHSRCESSSSGRGTSSDAGSSASQNGDEGEPASNLPSPGNNHRQVLANNVVTSSNSSGANSDNKQVTEKKHRRKSSLFKASKVFGGSQASLSKIKSFFTGRSTADLPRAPQLDLPVEERLRCLELSEPSCLSVDTSQADAEHLQNLHNNKDTISGGQGSCDINGQSASTTARSHQVVKGNEAKEQQQQQQRPTVQLQQQVALVSLEMDLMEKVRQVGENYELNKYKSLNKTIELDARLANDRLLATKLRLSQVNAMNDKLSKQLRLAQQQYQVQEKKLLLTETMLRQLIDSREAWHHHHHHHPHHLHSSSGAGGGVGSNSKQQATSGGRLARFRGRASGKTSQAQQLNAQQQQQHQIPVAHSRATQAGGHTSGAQATIGEIASSDNVTAQQQQQQWPIESNLEKTANSSFERKLLSNSATQTQMSRTKTIISDLRQRFNLVGSRGKGLRDNSSVAIAEPPLSADGVSPSSVVLQRMARQVDLTAQSATANTTASNGNGKANVGEQQDEEELDDNDDDGDGDGDDADELEVYDASLDNDLLLQALDLRRRSISLNNILDTKGGSYIHELATGQQIIISRGWPERLRSGTGERGVRKWERRRSRSASRVELAHHLRRPSQRNVRLDEQQKLSLLVRYLRNSGSSEPQVLKVLPSAPLRQSEQPAANQRRSSRISNKLTTRRVNNQQQQQHTKTSTTTSSPVGRRSGTRSRQSLIVQYDLPVHSAANGAIALGAAD